MLVIGSLNQWILLGLTLIISSAEAFRIPASTAFIPEILKEECYEQGLSFNCLQAPLVSQVFSAGEMMLSVISVAFMLGMIIGAVVYPTMKAKFGKKMIYRLGILSIAFYYFSFVIEAIWIHSVLGLYLCVCIVSFGVGSLVAAVNCLVNVEIMKEIDTAYLARVSALLSSAGFIGKWRGRLLHR